MRKKATLNNGGSADETTGISRISVAGYKSISQETSIEIRPLTILAGANSSGKSSIMQPLLLLKQTLEASYDPGALLLDGPNVKFTAADQFLSSIGKHDCPPTFRVGIESGDTSNLAIEFSKHNKKLDIRRMNYERAEEKLELRPDMSHNEIKASLPKEIKGLASAIFKKEKIKCEWEVIRHRCFLALSLTSKDKKGVSYPVLPSLSPDLMLNMTIRGLIHLPGLRGNPERTSPVTAVENTFPGTFESYTASVISRWQDRNQDILKALSKDLERLGLTWKVIATPINDTQVELQVGRLTHAVRGGAHDLVNIADVGFGVSQTLPVLVALHVAEPGQIVYLEQPEIHLHPRAQTAMAQVIADAAKRGVCVIVETHSNLLLLGVQTLVAEERLSPGLVKLHWFSRHDDGSTIVQSADLDEAGAFGDWPEDFADVELEAEDHYLTAAGEHQRVH